MRSNSQNRILSPTFNSSSTSSLKDFKRRRRGSELPLSESSGSIRIGDKGYERDRDRDRERRRRSDFVQAPLTHSPSPSPMVLSPSATRQFYYSRPSSREGSVTPALTRLPPSHSCSNASIVSESTAE